MFARSVPTSDVHRPPVSTKSSKNISLESRWPWFCQTVLKSFCVSRSVWRDVAGDPFPHPPSLTYRIFHLLLPTTGSCGCGVCSTKCPRDVDKDFPAREPAAGAVRRVHRLNARQTSVPVCRPRGVPGKDSQPALFAAVVWRTNILLVWSRRKCV